MPVKMKPISTIKVRLGIEPNGRVQSYLAEVCEERMRKYVPEDTGALKDNVIVEPDKITYRSKYAHYQYVGEMYMDPVYKKGAFYSKDYGFWSRPGVKKVPSGRPLKYHGGGGSYWDKKMVSAEMADVVADVQRFIDRGGRR